MTMRENSKVVKNRGKLHKSYAGGVNFPVYRMSSIVFPTLEDYNKALSGENVHHDTTNDRLYNYGRNYNPTAYELVSLLGSLEFKNGGECHSLLYPSGVMALVLSLTALCSAGSHVLMPLGAYHSTMDFIVAHLSNFGVTYSIYKDLPDLQSKIQDNTAVIFIENPTSLKFDFIDFELVIKIAKEKEIYTLCDNSWSTPLGCRPLELGVDVCVYSLTKYISGHSDVIMGIAHTSKEIFPKLYEVYRGYGVSVASSDCYLVQRGMRTLATRLAAHEENASYVVDNIKDSEVLNDVLYPMLFKGEKRTNWDKYFTRSNGLFSVVLKDIYNEDDLHAMFDSMDIFNIGLSWGGYSSMVLPINLKNYVGGSDAIQGVLIRFFCGLESKEDLLEDVLKALEALHNSYQNRISIKDSTNV